MKIRLRGAMAIVPAQLAQTAPVGASIPALACKNATVPACAGSGPNLEQHPAHLRAGF